MNFSCRSLLNLRAVIGVISLVFANAAVAADVIPGEYAPVEYVEATGTQYVKTWYVPNRDTRVVCEYQLTQTGKSSNYIFGSYSKNSGWNASYYFWFSHTTKAGVGYPGTSSTAKTLTYDLNRHAVDFNRGTVAVDGTDIGLSLTWTDNSTGAPAALYLFARNTRKVNTVEDICTARIYSFRVTENGEVMLDFEPVVRVSDNAPGFYDRVSGRFYGSAVSDPLIAGPFVSFSDSYLHVTATPGEFGNPSPAYGTNTEQVASLPVSTDAEVIRPDGVTKLHCTGWKLYRLDSATHAWTLETSGTETSFTLTPPSPAAPRKLVWQYDEYTINLTAGDHGTVSYDTGYHKDGDTVSVAVTPESGYAFFKWDVVEGSVMASDTNILLKGVVRAQAVFAPVVDLLPGTDAISGAIAARFADAGDVPTVFRLASGNYSESASNHAVWLTNAYHVVGIGERPEDVVVTRTASSANVFYLDHADAEVRHLMIKDGNGNTNKQPQNGGNVGIGSSGGTVIDCVIANGKLGTYNSAGGNIYMLAGLVSRCVVTNGNISGNNQGSGGGGICAIGTAKIENSLIGWSTSKHGPLCSGVALYGKASLVNCTVVGNGHNACMIGGVGAHEADTRVVNCAIFDNVIGTGGNETWGGFSDSFVNCASITAVNDNCISAPSPGFKASGQRDYSLTVSSPLRNAGADYCKVAALSAADLSGVTRVSQGVVDIGAYEFVSSGMTADFTSDVNEGIAPLSVTFTATVEGAKGSVTYGWDYNGDGVVDEETNVPVVTHEYSLGNVYTVKLTVSDGVSPTVTASHEDMIKTCQKDLYVAPAGTGSDEYPYATWATAAASVQDAVDAAVPGCVVHVAAGEYLSSSALSVKKAIRIEGHSGNPNDVMVRCTSGSSRVLYIDAAEAVVANCTLKGYNCGGSGRVVLIENEGGSVSNCVVIGDRTLCFSTSYSSCALIAATRGHISHSTVTGYCVNHLSANQYGPSAVSLNNGSSFTDSLVVELESRGISNEDNSGGSIVRASNRSQVSNCTIVNCTNAYIRARTLYADDSSSFTNCVLVGNVYTNGVPFADIAGTTNNFGMCAFDVVDVPNPSCITVSSADFKNFAAGDYVPAFGGALHNTGATIANPPATDLAGKQRVVKQIDIGCYELQLPKGLQLFLR